MLSENQKRFISLVYACPLQGCIGGCYINSYRTGISHNRIIKKVQQISKHDVDRVLKNHNNCFKKRSQELHSKQIRHQFEIKMNLTERQFEIVKLICEKLTNNDVAEKLQISPHTVANHRRKVYKQLNVKNIKELKSVIFKKEFFQNMS